MGPAPPSPAPPPPPPAKISTMGVYHGVQWKIPKTPQNWVRQAEVSGTAGGWGGGATKGGMVIGRGGGGGTYAVPTPKLKVRPIDSAKYFGTLFMYEITQIITRSAICLDNLGGKSDWMFFG